MATDRRALLGLERPGVRVRALLPDQSWRERWDSILVPAAQKRRLVNAGLLRFGRKPVADPVTAPWHGVVLLAGPPGTGKTTLAHGLGNRIASELVARGLAEQLLFAEVDPHAFPSELLGESQRATARLFSHTLPELAAQGLPTVVLIDEVESLAVSRSRASATANPIDVHRSTNAVLTGLDALTTGSPNVLIVATTNDESLLDEAFLSRVDLVERFAPPGADVVAELLAQGLEAVGVDVSGGEPQFAAAARCCVDAGLDARQVRKLVLGALLDGPAEVALAPEQLTVGGFVDYVARALAVPAPITAEPLDHREQPSWR